MSQYQTWTRAETLVSKAKSRSAEQFHSLCSLVYIHVLLARFARAVLAQSVHPPFMPKRLVLGGATLGGEDRRQTAIAPLQQFFDNMKRRV